MKKNLPRIREIASELLFEVNDEVLKDFSEFFEEHLTNLAKLQKINTTGLTPFTFADETPIDANELRDDVPGEALAKDILLKNANQTNGDLVAITREANDD